jgi:hypothetical protein
MLSILLTKPGSKIPKDDKRREVINLVDDDDDTPRELINLRLQRSVECARQNAQNDITSRSGALWSMLVNLSIFFSNR